MSVKLMSAIFAMKITDLKDGAGNVTKGSTATLVLLALADHANDEGEGAYPGLVRMEHKTSLSHQTILSAYKALKHNGIITYVGRSKVGTSDYTINTQYFSSAHDEKPLFDTNQADVPLKPLACQDSSHLSEGLKPLACQDSSHLSGVLKPLELKHPLTTIKPSREIYSGDFAKIWTELEQLCGAVAPDTARLIEVWIGKHPVERILQAVSLARDKRAGSPKYVDQVLITWEANGYPPTREEQVLSRAFKPAKGKNGIEPNRYQIPNYSEADLAVAAEINRMSRLEEAGLVES